MTTALYRRYRPETFQEVIGQEHVTEPLMAALRGERVTHAYLFSGPRGCGKTTSARILARALNCAQYPTDTPCGECASCRDLARGGSGSLDVVEIDAASHGGVDDARELRERATFAPARDRFKVFIIDEAHMVSPQGFNALLKLVEEPPEHVKFIFATTEPEKVIGTIRSRTHHYPFRLVPPEVLERYLGSVCGEEGVEVGGGVLPLVVRAGGGSVRDSLSVLDQLVAGAVDGSLDYGRATALLGYTDAALLDDVADAIGARDGAALFASIDRVVQSGHDPRRFVEDLLERLRDLVVLAVAGEAGAGALSGFSDDQLERLRGQSEHLGARRLSAVADLVNDALTEMTGATSPRLQLELLGARMLLVGDTEARAGGADGGPDDAGVAGEGEGRRTSPAPRLRVEDSRIRPPQTDQRAAEQSATSDPTRQQTTRQQARPAQAPGAPQGAEASQPTRAPQSTQDPQPEQVAQPAPVQPQGQGQQTAPASGDAARMIQQRWEEALGAVQSRVVSSILKQYARPGELAGDALRIDFANPGVIRTFVDRGGEEDLARALYEALGVRVRVVVAAGGDATPAPAAMGGWQSQGAERPCGQGPDGDRENARSRGGRSQASRPEDEQGRAAAAARGTERQGRAAPRESGPAPARRSQDDADPDSHRPAAEPPLDEYPPAAEPVDEEVVQAVPTTPRRQAAPAPAPVEEDETGWPTVAVPGQGYRDDSGAPAQPPAPDAQHGTGGGFDASGGFTDAEADADDPGAPGADAVAAPADNALADGTPADDADPVTSPPPDTAGIFAEADERRDPGLAQAVAGEHGTAWATAPADDPTEPDAPTPGVPLTEPPGASAGASARPPVGTAGAQAGHSRPAHAVPGQDGGGEQDGGGRAAAPQHPWERHLPASATAWSEPEVTDDDVSPDDADAEGSSLVGLPVLQQVLGATVLEEIDTTQNSQQRGW